MILLTSLLLLLNLTSCVSVKIGSETKITRSQSYTFQKLPNQFEDIKSNDFDHYFKNNKTGNTLIVLTSCGDDPSLEEILQSHYLGLNEVNILEKVLFLFNERQALKQKAEANIDGIAVFLSSISLKKNNCNYLISYFGTKKNFPKDQAQFDSFIESFRVQ